MLDAGALHPRRSAENHLAWLAASNGIARSRVDEVLELVGLTTVAKRRAGGFSLGMRQRLGIAASLLGDPEVLLYDEPVNGLDPEGIVWVRNFLRALAGEGKTVLVSSHLMSRREPSPPERSDRDRPAADWIADSPPWTIPFVKGARPRQAPAWSRPMLTDWRHWRSRRRPRWSAREEAQEDGSMLVSQVGFAGDRHTACAEERGGRAA